MESFYSWAVGFLPSKTTALNWGNFESLVISSKDPWLIDFYSPWCGPCQVCKKFDN
jgi:thioredoxin-like negative regulator of GroEL